MPLTDKEILELNDLCNALVDGTINPAQKSRLEQWLDASEDARRQYIRTLGLSASLHSYASEMQSEPADALPAPRKVLHFPAWVWLGPLAVAAAVVVVVLTRGWPGGRDPVIAASKADESVARLTGSKGCQWVEGSAAIRTGERLHQGQRMELAAGFAEITFDSGAQVVLKGPASLGINSAWDATLRRGTLKATVPLQAIGFRISNPAVEVVDLGTEFTIEADGNGAAEVLVLKGEVEADPGEDDDQQTIVLREKEARRFASSGVTSVDDSESKFELWAKPLPMDRFDQATEYRHWSFDENAGVTFKADAFGAPLHNFDAQLGFDAQMGNASEAALAPLRTEGRWHGALRFDGHLFGRAPSPGISGNSPHTVAFWVKVPEQVQLSDAYAMVAWGTANKKQGSHPVQICWNRNPTEGTVGVLRTDYGGGFALGATPLRDGRWHHIAVVVVPGDDHNSPMEVKQYVDGRFEGEGNPSPPGRRNGLRASREEDGVNVNDAIWLGCRLGANGKKKERFRGELDELCTANRALEPQEIVQLMKNNRPPQSSMSVAKR
jgi:hypothetical protein